MENGRKSILKPFEDSKKYIDSRLSKTIEEHRKGVATIKVTDKNGSPVKGAHITAGQKSHDFKYGANIFMLDEFETHEKNKIYRDSYKQICNYATLPFYWKDLEPTEGKPRFHKDCERVYRRPAIDLCLEYCEENNIRTKEHCLVYETWMPEWLDKTDPRKMKERYERRIAEIAERYADRIEDWEVTNETLYKIKNCSALYKEPDLIEWAFELARRYLPKGKLIMNEANFNILDVFCGNRSPFYMQIERALKNNAPIDKLGMQFHMFYKRESEAKMATPYYNAEFLCEVMERFDDFRMPIQMTETSIPAYSTDEEDEWIQAEIIKYLYSIWFGHPSVESIQYWNLVDGYAAFAPLGDMTKGENYFHAGLMRFDMTPKPAFHAVKELFENTWATKEELTTNEEGCAELKGFFGKYDLEITADGKKIKTEAGIHKDNRSEIRIEMQ